MASEVEALILVAVSWMIAIFCPATGFLDDVWQSQEAEGSGSTSWLLFGAMS